MNSFFTLTDMFCSAVNSIQAMDNCISVESLQKTNYCCVIFTASLLDVRGKFAISGVSFQVDVSVLKG